LEELKYSSEEDFFAALTAGAPPDATIIALWAEGVVFSHSVLPPTETIIKDFTEGIVYWNFVKYARMDNFEPEKTHGMYRIKIIKATAPALIEAAKALKERF
jgi:hypothetical protein